MWFRQFLLNHWYFCTCYFVFHITSFAAVTQLPFLLSRLDLNHPQLCMLCSVGYHLFCCHRSEKTSRRWMALDYAGVSIGILGCYVPGVFYTFYCNNVSLSSASKVASLIYLWFVSTICLPAKGFSFLCVFLAHQIRVDELYWSHAGNWGLAAEIKKKLHSIMRCEAFRDSTYFPFIKLFKLTK